MKILINTLLWIWQLPQNLIGFVLSLFYQKRRMYFTTFYTGKLFNSAVSLGQYIIIDDVHFQCSDEYFKKSIKHEKGHSKQSQMLGLFYLLIVGLPSFFRNIYDRLFHKDWTYLERTNWYYNGYPERWANKLGNVKGVILP